MKRLILIITLLISFYIYTQTNEQQPQGQFYKINQPPDERPNYHTNNYQDFENRYLNLIENRENKYFSYAEVMDLISTFETVILGTKPPMQNKQQFLQQIRQKVQENYSQKS